MIKVFGVGNLLLCDDGIGVRVAEEVKDVVEKNYNAKVIIGECDYLYCLDNIKRDDFVVIIDSAYFGKKPGEVFFIPLPFCDKFISKSKDSHSESFIKVIRKEFPEINGAFIGIEISEIKYYLDLSNELRNKFKDICDTVLKIINKLSSMDIKCCN